MTACQIESRLSFKDDLYDSTARASCSYVGRDEANDLLTIAAVANGPGQPEHRR